MEEEIYNMVHPYLNPLPGSGLGPESSIQPATDGVQTSRSVIGNMIHGFIPVYNIFDYPETDRSTVSSADLYRIMIRSASINVLPNDERSIPYARTRVNRNENEEIEKSSENNESFFDCNICFDLSKDPIVTSCGHLFCWSCFHQWLQTSRAKECPVCKGEISQNTVTPIYGRGNHRRESEENSHIKIPSRPQARRVDSFRTVFNRFLQEGDVDETMRRIREMNERETMMLRNRFMTSRGIRAEQNQTSAAIVEPLRERQRFNSLLIGRQFESQASDQRLSSSVDVDVDVDGDSVSSVIGVIVSENGADNAVEVSSMADSSTSSLKRKRVEDSSGLDSEDESPMKRRRLT